MNVVQKKLLELSDTVDLGAYSYYWIAKKLGIDHPYKVQFAIEQLIKKGYLSQDAETGSMIKLDEKTSTQGLVSIPYYGRVNCGEALTLADDQIKDYLRVTPNVLKVSNLSGIFALKAHGDSMNRANVNGKAVHSGDYVIAKRDSSYTPQDGDYVISIIGGAANLKRFYKDAGNRQVLLISQSSNDLPPIIISEYDTDNLSTYSISAKVIDVIPMPAVVC